MAGYQNKANFMKHLAPDNVIQATDLKGMDQCGRAAIVHGKEARRAMMQGAPFPGFTAEQWERDHRAKRWLEKRKERGGSTYNAGNILEQY